jgi:glycosyltransferase involved in cell wall biosynthesis
MKIAISSLSDIAKNDGTSLRAKRVFKLLQENYDCTLIIRGKHNVESDDVEVIRPSKFWNFQLMPVVLKNRYDLVYCSNDFWGFFTYFAFAKLLSYKVIFEAHGILSRERELSLSHSPTSQVGLKILKWRERFVIKHADCVIALAQDIDKYYSRFNKCIFIVDNFIDETQFKPQTKSGERVSDGKEKKDVGLIGPFDENNINNYFLDFVYQNIDRFDARIRFIVIGQCDHKLTHERMVYAGYFNEFEDYVDQLTHLDAVLVPAKFSSFGALTKVLEAMACSVPVFMTPAGLVSFDHVTPGEDILVCEASELVAKVNESLFDPDLIERVGKNARKTVEKHYDKKVNKEKLIAVIERLSPHQ